MINDKPYDMKIELANIYRQLLECIRSLVNAANNSNYIRELANIDYSLVSWHYKWYLVICRIIVSE